MCVLKGWLYSSFILVRGVLWKWKEYLGLIVIDEDSFLEGIKVRECRNSGNRIEFKNLEVCGMRD